jgi:phosphatidylserine decarboxylase
MESTSLLLPNARSQAIVFLSGKGRRVEACREGPNPAFSTGSGAARNVAMAFKESLRFFIGFVLLALLFGWVYPFLAVVPGLLAVYTLYFFRDPERPISADPLDIVSSADGKVIGVDEVDETHFGKGRMKRVAVFLSVFDVHVNRTPVAGKILKSDHKPGEFLDARHGEVDLRNESQNWLIETVRGQVVVRQIAGLIARRIVAWSKPGDLLEKGQRFGMIRFGSRTDVYLPLECTVLVKKGDRVQGGASVIARWS